MKKILITQRIVENESYPETRDCLDVRWAKLFDAINLLPIIAPSHLSVDNIAKYEFEGILFSGGNDLSCLKSDKNSAARDEFEFQVLQLGLSKKIPILGVCRGMQFLANYFKAPLKKTDGHTGKNHEVELFPERSRFLPETLNSAHVNSFHNYGPASCPENFNIIAQTKTGDIEAIEHKELDILAFMWHPERCDQFQEIDLTIMKNFFTGTKK